MIARMPVLRKNNVAEAGRNAIDGVDHGVAISHGQRAARAKVVLYIDDNQNVVRGDPQGDSYARNFGVRSQKFVS
jgi:hypothetical protein